MFDTPLTIQHTYVQIGLLSYTYTSIALDTRLLAQPYRPSQIELSSPVIQNSCRGLIGGLIAGLIFFCPALPSSWSRPGEKKGISAKIKKWTYSCIFLPDSNQNCTENTIKTLKYPFSYMEYLHTNGVSVKLSNPITSKPHATFSHTKGLTKCLWAFEADKDT